MHLHDHSSIVALANTSSSVFIKNNLCHSLFFPLWLTRTCVESSWYQEGLTKSNLCLVPWAPCKSSDLDPIPTSLVKNCIDILVVVGIRLSCQIMESTMSLVMLCSHWWRGDWSDLSRALAWAKVYVSWESNSTSNFDNTWFIDERQTTTGWQNGWRVSRANTKHRVKQWALIRTDSNAYYHDISPLLR